MNPGFRLAATRTAVPVTVAMEGESVPGGCHARVPAGDARDGAEESAIGVEKLQAWTPAGDGAILFLDRSAHFSRLPHEAIEETLIVLEQDESQAAAHMQMTYRELRQKLRRIREDRLAAQRRAQADLIASCAPACCTGCLPAGGLPAWFRRTKIQPEGVNAGTTAQPSQRVGERLVISGSTVSGDKRLSQLTDQEPIVNLDENPRPRSTASGGTVQSAQGAASMRIRKLKDLKKDMHSSFKTLANHDGASTHSLSLRDVLGKQSARPSTSSYAVAPGLNGLAGVKTPLIPGDPDANTASNTTGTAPSAQAITSADAVSEASLGSIGGAHRAAADSGSDGHNVYSAVAAVEGAERMPPGIGLDRCRAGQVKGQLAATTVPQGHQRHADVSQHSAAGSTHSAASARYGNSRFEIRRSAPQRLQRPVTAEEVLATRQRLDLAERAANGHGIVNFGYYGHPLSPGPMSPYRRVHGSASPDSSGRYVWTRVPVLRFCLLGCVQMPLPRQKGPCTQVDAVLALIPQDGMRARRLFLWRCWSSCVSPDCPRRSVYRRVCLTTQSIRPCMHACVCVSVSVFEIYSCPSSLHVSENTSKQACIHTHLNARTYTHARTHAHEI